MNIYTGNGFRAIATHNSIRIEGFGSGTNISPPYIRLYIRYYNALTALYDLERTDWPYNGSYSYTFRNLTPDRSYGINVGVYNSDGSWKEWLSPFGNSSDNTLIEIWTEPEPIAPAGWVEATPYIYNGRTWELYIPYISPNNSFDEVTTYIYTG